MSYRKRENRIRRLFAVDATYKIDRLYQLKSNFTYKKSGCDTPEEKTVKPETCYPVKYLETLEDFNSGNIPFDLYVKPDPILQTDPNVLQKPIEKPPDVGRKDAQKSRPRLMISPQLNIDDVDDEIRDLVISDTYQSEKAITQRRVWEDIHMCSTRATCSTRAPLGRKLAPVRPIYVPKLKPPVVPHEWRMETVKNLRYKYPRYPIDANVLFWDNFNRTSNS